MLADLEYVIERLEQIHPMTVNGFSYQQNAIISNIRQAINGPIRKNEFFFLINQLFHSFKDAHTNVWSSWKEGIPIPLLWLENQLVVEFDTEYHQRGDKIITIGNRDVDFLYNELKSIICGENNHYVKLMGQSFLISSTFLDYYNLINDDSVTIMIERDKLELETRLPVIQLGPRPQSTEYKWIDYKIDSAKDIAVLVLNECRYYSDYMDTLFVFFKEVCKNDVNNIVLDLRNNSGGNSNVINEFLRYLNKDRYKWFGTSIRHSKYARKMKGESGFGYQEHMPSVMVSNKVSDEELLFKGNLFVLTSKSTFSSANMFAVVIKDNEFGTIIGEPTGNAPSCYGDALEFRMPKTQIDFRVSYKYFMRPEPDAGTKPYLNPDILLIREIGDVISKRDPQLEEVYRIINSY